MRPFRRHVRGALQLEKSVQNPFEESGESGEALLSVLTIQASEMRLKNLSLLSSLSSLSLHGFSSELGLLADQSFRLRLARLALSAARTPGAESI